MGWATGRFGAPAYRDGGEAERRCQQDCAENGLDLPEVRVRLVAHQQLGALAAAEDRERAAGDGGVRGDPERGGRGDPARDRPGRGDRADGADEAECDRRHQPAQQRGTGEASADHEDAERHQCVLDG